MGNGVRAVNQQVTAPQVLLLLDLIGSLAVLLGDGEGER
jgi:hypothetical protein